MIFKNKNKAKLGIMLFFATTTVANAQYNNDYIMAPYSDTQTLESNVDLGDRGLITVGSINVKDVDGTHKDVIVTRLDPDGNVIWNFRYGDRGNDEVANGVTLAWDDKTVIVVGSISKAGAGDDGAVIERQALVLKIDIVTGALGWATHHGVKEWDEQALLVKRSNAGDDRTYVVVGESQGDPDQPNIRMYAFGIDDGGTQVWSNRYYLSDNEPAMHPTAMVEDDRNQFMIAGIREEGDRPSEIFTIGIQSNNGDVIKPLNHNPIREIYNVGTVDIDLDPEGNGYAISFTARDFSGDCRDDIGDRETDRIGILRLDPDRNLLWSKVYWEKEATNQNGLSIRFYKEYLHVCININRADRYNTPGFLSVLNGDGSFVFSNTYHEPISEKDYGPIGNHMIRSNTDDEYYIKSIYAKQGFAMVNIDLAGRAECYNETRLMECEYRTERVEEKCDDKEYGRYDRLEIPYVEVRYRMILCEEGFEGVAPQPNGGNDAGTSGSLPINKVLVYPSPVTEGQDIVNLKFITDSEVGQGNVTIMNSMGQVVVNSDIVFITGENKFEFDTKQFSTGLYVVMVTVDGELMDQVKFVKN